MEARPATLEDCAALARGMKVVVDEGVWLATEGSVGEDDLEQRFRFSVESHEHHPFVLTENGEVIGGLGMNPTNAPGVLALGMWVLPEWRGRGGGRLLANAAIDGPPRGRPQDRARGLRRQRARPIALHRLLSFEQEGVRRHHYRREDGSLRWALVMARLF